MYWDYTIVLWLEIELKKSDKMATMYYRPYSSEVGQTM